MKKHLLTLFLTFIFSYNLNAQWVTKKIDNGLDEPYKICYDENIYGDLLKMENNNGVVTVYVQDETICEESDISTNLSFFVNGEWKRYDFICNSFDEKFIILIGDLTSEENVDVINDFKNCTKIKFRFNYEYCEPEIYEFNMAGSTAALNFIMKQL
jgi:hypothetical protein